MPIWLARQGAQIMSAAIWHLLDPCTPYQGAKQIIPYGTSPGTLMMLEYDCGNGPGLVARSIKTHSSSVRKPPTPRPIDAPQFDQVTHC